MTEQVPHRPGPFKLPNKAHKSGRHRTNRQINRETRGRTDVKTITRKFKHRSASRQERRNTTKQQRQFKRQAIQEQNRNLSRAPYLVTVLSLSEELDAARIVERLAAADEDAQVVPSERGNITYLNVPRFHARYGFVCPLASHVDNVLDCLKVSDIVLFAWPLDGTLSSEQDVLMSIIMAHGLPSHVNVVAGLPDKGKQRERLRSNVTALIEACNLTTDKLLNLDNEQDGLQILRQLQTCKKQYTILQSRRPHLMVEKMERTNVGHGLCTLKLTGFIRGPAFDANRLVHIQGFGDFQLEQIDRIPDPIPGSKDPNFHTQTLKPDEKQYDLETEITPDPMDAEQPNVDDMVKSEEMFKKPTVVKKVPKGTSSYQAAWILDSDEDEEGSGEDEDESFDENDSEDEENMAPRELKGPGFFDDQNEMDIDAMTVGTLGNEEYEDMETDIDAVEKFRRERENAQFPDEVDTPLDRPAAERFQKYRGLKSFRTSPWDPKENLPYDYGRIFKFGNIKHTKKLVLKEIDSEPTPNHVIHGNYVTLYVKNVPAHLPMEWGNDMPMVVYGLLKHEQRMSILNVVLRRHPSFTHPIKNKELLIYHIGYRRFEAGAIFSQHTIGDKFKMERFMPEDDTTFVASMFAPIMFPPASVLVFRRDSKGNQQLVASGTVLDTNPDRIVLKRVVLTGHPTKIQRRLVIARYMFFRPEDIEWFKPVEIYTAHGRRGHIKQALGTHGYMKCVFDQPVGKQDIIMMNLYKRVFPKWTFNPIVPRPKPIGGGMINARSLVSLVTSTADSHKGDEKMEL